jgi:hypothetical protein
MQVHKTKSEACLQIGTVLFAVLKVTFTYTFYSVMQIEYKK